jgi:hypothetical protein
MAAALLAASLPAIEEARHDRTDARLDATVERIERAVDAIRTAEDPTRRDVPGARRPLAVRVPARSWSAAGVAWVAVGGTPVDAPGPDGNASLVAYRLDGGPTRRRRLPGVGLRTPRGAVTLREPGRHRIRLRLRLGRDSRADGPVVLVDRPRRGAR